MSRVLIIGEISDSYGAISDSSGAKPDSYGAISDSSHRNPLIYNPFFKAKTRVKQVTTSFNNTKMDFFIFFVWFFLHLIFYFPANN